MIVCDKLARKIVLTIRQFLSSSGIDERCDKRMTVIAGCRIPAVFRLARHRRGAVFPGFHHHGNSFGLGTFSSALALVDFKNSSRASLTLRHGSGWPTLCDFVLCLPAAGRQRVGNSLLRF